MRKTLVIMSLALGTAAMAATLAPAGDRHATAVKAKADLSRKAPVGVEMPSTVAKFDASSVRTDDPVYDHETVIVGTSRYDYQHNGSYGKMIAVSSDGVAHGSYMGGANISAGRRVLAWCVTPDLTMPSATANVTDTRAGYITQAVTSANPSNGLAGNSSVVSYHTAAGSWVGSDFDGCTMAFSLFANTESADILWPHVALDYMDKAHIAAGDATTDTATEDYAYYNATTNWTSWDGEYAVAVTNSNTLSETTAAAKNAPGAAVIVLPDAPATPEIFYDATNGASQWHHDIAIYEARDADNDIFAQIAAGNLINITKYHDPDSDAPFRHGAFAYADVDGIYDSQVTPDLHLAWPTPASFADSMMYKEVGNDTLYFTAFSNVDSWHSAIWHYNVTQNEWGHIAGWLTGEDEYDVPADSMMIGVFRMAKDRVQLAHDPSNGYLYALWNQYSTDDVRNPQDNIHNYKMANGELYVACSADNGRTWGPHINLTNSPSPGCVSPDCFSETFGSMAEIVSNGYLHITFMMDKHAGSSIRNGSTDNDGSFETVNNYYYMRVPVADVPPAAGDAWDAQGHVGLSAYKRQWRFTNGHLDTVQMVDRIAIFNEGRQPVSLTRLTLYHDQLDVFGDENSNLWYEFDVMQGDPVEPGEWIENPTDMEDWNGVIPAWGTVLTHLSVGHRGLPMREQIAKFEFSDGTVRLYRFIYQVASAQGDGSLIEVMDETQLGSYAATVVYENSNAVEPVTEPKSFNLAQNVPNPFNPATQISFDMGVAGPASLKVFNLQGALVATLVDGPIAAGNHTVAFDGSQLSSGVYFYTLQAAGRSETRKMLLTK